MSHIYKSAPVKLAVCVILILSSIAPLAGCGASYPIEAVPAVIVSNVYALFADNKDFNAGTLYDSTSADSSLHITDDMWNNTFKLQASGVTTDMIDEYGYLAPADPQSYAGQVMVLKAAGDSNSDAAANAAKLQTMLQAYMADVQTHFKDYGAPLDKQMASEMEVDVRGRFVILLATPDNVAALKTAVDTIKGDVQWTNPSTSSTAAEPSMPETSNVAVPT